jgi:hypothetical protein
MQVGTSSRLSPLSSAAICVGMSGLLGLRASEVGVGGCWGGGGSLVIGLPD